MTRIGLLGGTFDPPHVGHLVVAEAVRDTLDLDQVRLLVAGTPWMKGAESAVEHRLAMCRAAVADHDGLAVDDRETRRDGPTYTADTLADLRASEPDVEWTFVVGTDAAARLPEWGRITEALDLARWVVVTRPGSHWPDHELADRLVAVEVPAVDVSSSALRERIRDGRSVQCLVPEPVIAYIARHRLYRPPDGGPHE